MLAEREGRMEAVAESSKQGIEAVQRRSRSPDVPRLLEALNAYQIRYVITGSVAAQLYGVDLQPGDLDITPALDGQNLTRLVSLLVEIEAALPDGDEVGRWEVQPDGERKWISRTATPEDRQRRARWQPDPEDVASLDHLFYTRYGNLDVVPELTGGYDTLLKRATRMIVDGHQVWVVHVDELLAALTIPRRKKDTSRVQQLREIQRTGVRPRTGVHWRMGVR
jgi:hypothetical protein